MQACLLFPTFFAEPLDNNLCLSIPKKWQKECRSRVKQFQTDVTVIEPPVEEVPDYLEIQEVTMVPRD